MIRLVALLVCILGITACAGRAPENERPEQGQINPAQSPRNPTQEIFIKPSAHPDDQDWASADPSDPRSAGNLGPAGSHTRKDIAPSAPAGTPGERVPEHTGPTGLPGEDPQTHHPYDWRY